MAGHFSEFGMLPELVQGIDEMGWSLPTDIQAEAIPLILGGGDVLMAAETGSGKTGAFSLPVIQIVHENLVDAKQGKRGAAASGTGKWGMSMHDRQQSFAVAEDGLLCQAREQRTWQGARSTLGVTKGWHYYEATVTDEGLCRIGFSTSQATYDVGTDGHSFGFGGTGKKSFMKNFETYGEPFGINDVIGCFIDLNDFQIKWSKNGKEFPIAYDIPKNLRGSTFYASVTLKNAELRFNFGDTPFKHLPQGSFQGLVKANSNDVVKNTVGAAPAKFTNISSPAALIMEPSRELAQQTHDQINLFKKYMPDPKPQNALLVGGGNAREQINALESGVDIVTGTPGKIQDFVQSGKLSLEQVRFLIFDELDGLLSQSQGDLIQNLFHSCPKVSSDGRRLQVIACSATLHNFDVKKLAEKIMHFPTWIDLKGQDSVPDTVHHVVLTVDPTQDQSWKGLRERIQTDGIHARDNINPNSMNPETLSEATKLLKGEYAIKAILEHKMDQGIIFCRTKLDCDNLERYMNRRSQSMSDKRMLSCVCLHSDRAPRERQQNLQTFKDRRANFLICTDVAARGIDIKGVPYVINVTLPDDKANYIHRIGRVGRAERMGLAMSFVAKHKEKVWYHKCDSRGKNCNNTRLVEQGGCSIWYDEPTYIGNIEEHLGETISSMGTDMKVPVNEFDGKVSYGSKRKQQGSNYNYHTSEIAGAVKELAQMEKTLQDSYLNFIKDWTITTTK